MSKVLWTDPVTHEEWATWFPTTITGKTTLKRALKAPVPYYQQREEIITGLVQEGYWVKATGSRVTRDGWTDDSDWDYVVYDPENTLHSKLSKDVNWKVDGSGNGVLGVDFQSYKQGQTNLIVVCKDSTWKKYIIATNLLRMMNPKTKKERCAIFDSVFEKDVNSRAVEF